MELFQAYHLLIFLSLATSPLAIAKYAKTGCSYKCGNVVIPFPFGIGEKCFLNEWFAVDCNSSTPYLSAFGHLQVLGVDLKNRTVTVNMHKVSACGQMTKSVDLSRSPFLFSSLHNKFVYEGFCGNAVMMDDHGITLTGCSTTCSNVKTATVSNRNTCFGINCCERAIPQVLQSYIMNLTGIERRMGGDGACGSVYLLDKDSYIEGSPLSRQSKAEGTSYVPTSLLWIISDRDKHQVSCYDDGSYGRLIDLGNGTLLTSWMCRSLVANEGNPYLIDGFDGTDSILSTFGFGVDFKKLFNAQSYSSYFFQKQYTSL